MSVVLTVISLGTRVALAYCSGAPCPPLGWWASGGAVPIGWMLADAVGLAYYWKIQGGLLKARPGVEEL